MRGLDLRPSQKVWIKSLVQKAWFRGLDRIKGLDWIKGLKQKPDIRRLIQEDK